MTTTYPIRQAVPQDVSRLAQLLGEGFMADPVSGWIFPDEPDRRDRHARFFRPFVEVVLEYGRIDVVDDFDGAALWLDIDDKVAEPDVDLLRDACGPNWNRAERLFAIFDERHPAKPHAYLPFIVAARPGNGVGTALLNHAHAELDQSGRPAYLEASSPRNVKLYRRLGYEEAGEPIQPEGGPPLFPMWRPSG